MIPCLLYPSFCSRSSGTFSAFPVGRCGKEKLVSFREQRYNNQKTGENRLKGDRMKNYWKIRALALLAVLCCILNGCEKKQENAVNTPPPDEIAVSGEKTENLSVPEEKIHSLMKPYQEAADRLSQASPAGGAYTIPGSMLETMAGHIADTGAQPENGRYQFTFEQTNDARYQFSGLEITRDMALETTAPDDETPMGEGSISDLSVQGGGVYRRLYAYDADADLTRGRMEITEELNGEKTGHEVFTFCFRPDGFFFTDAMPEMKAELDALSVTGNYLITVGRWTMERAETAEYLSDTCEEPLLQSAQDWEQLLQEKPLLSHDRSN